MSEQEMLEQYNEMRRDEYRSGLHMMSNLDKLRELIPQGDGYNSDWANTISDAADELFDLRAKNAELVADYRIFAEWVYALSMHGIEIYKHELAASAADALDRIARNEAN